MKLANSPGKPKTVWNFLLAKINMSTVLGLSKLFCLATAACSPIHTAGQAGVSDYMPEVSTGDDLSTPSATNGPDIDTEPIYDDVNVCKCAWIYVKIMRCKTPYIQIFWFSKFIKPQETIQWWNQQTLFALPLRLIFVFLRKSKDLFFRGGRVAQCVAKSP